MSLGNLDGEKDYSNLTDALKFVFDQMLKNIYVSVPGIIESYDATTKRCRVKPAINIKLTDASTVEQSAIMNVPVLWPSGGGFTLLCPLPSGTPVEIKFSQRGITKFKETFSTADPGNGVFDKEDAHVIPGYGALSVTPATTSGIALQTEDGTNYLYVENGIVKMKATTEVNIDAPLIKMKGDAELDGDLDITGIIKGATVFNGPDSNAHAHPQGADSGGDAQVNTGVPV